MDKSQLSEADIISKFILPAVDKAGCDFMSELRQEVKLRDGKVSDCGFSTAFILFALFLEANRYQVNNHCDTTYLFVSLSCG
tara:strand:- start:386 stop:631 length:246 start_codon:yes stop_codon:yes gene_type:complete